MSDITERFALAVAVAREAGEVARKAYEQPATARTFKGPQDYVLESDAQVERVIRERVLAAFPNDLFFGEEGGGAFGRDVWVVDPIDGTTFARRIPHWCISIAFVRDMKTEVGVIYQPPTDEMYAGRRRRDVERQDHEGERVTDIRQAMIEAGWSSRLPPEPYVAMVDTFYQAGAEVRRLGSARSASPMWRTDAATAMSSCT